MMKRMKKAASFMALAAAMATLAAVPALAEEMKTSTTEFSYVQENEPTYTVTIPGSLALSKEGSNLDITATDVANLGDKRVAVTISGTNYFRNQLVLQAKTSNSSYTSVLRYQLIGADGTVIETTGEDTVSGREIASFTENGSVSYTAKPVLGSKGQNLEPGVSYTGTMTFGIALTE